MRKFLITSLLVLSGLYHLSAQEETLSTVTVAGVTFTYPAEGAIRKGVVRFIGEDPLMSFTGETSRVRGSVIKSGPGQTPTGRIIIDAASLSTGLNKMIFKFIKTGTHDYTIKNLLLK